MVANSISTINLKDYGSEGIIYMSFPSFSRQVWSTDEVSNHTGTETVGNEIKIIKPNVGTINTINTLAYIKDAPEPICKTVRINNRDMRIPDLEGFIDFCDQLDEANPGTSVEFVDKLRQVANEIASGAKSPFVNSREQTIIKSE